MLHPTYRERTDKFRQLRSSFMNRESNANPDNSDGPLLSNIPNHPTIISVSPDWMQSVDSIDSNIKQIKIQMGTLKEYHSLRQRVIFDDNKANEYDTEIQQISRSITALLALSKAKLQEIGMKGNDASVQLGFEERTARYNAMRSRAIKLQTIAKTVRNEQRQFLQNVEKLNKTHKYIDIGNVTQTLPDLSNVYDAQYTQQQIYWIEQQERDASEREVQILQIAKSVHELSTIFHELSVLVVEQGSLLDRIDYNVEQALETIENTVPIIRKTNEIHKRSKSALCILVLILLIIVFAIALILKHI